VDADQPPDSVTADIQARLSERQLTGLRGRGSGYVLDDARARRAVSSRSAAGFGWCRLGIQAPM
jgi:hypothetical protein